MREISIQSADFPQYPDSKITSLSSFAKGLGAQRRLQSLILGFINLGDNGITEIASGMKNVTSLITLKFISCNIKAAAKQVCSMALNNPALENFSLSCNNLEETGIEDIASTLPKLKNVTDLNLSNTHLTKAALTFLVFAIVSHNLNIKRLNLGIQDFKSIDPSLSLITTLITNNPHLKKLYLNFIDHIKLKKLAPLLADPNSCKLQEFYFLDPSTLLTTKSNKILLSILYQNEYLYDIGPIRKSRELYIACDRNFRKKISHEWNLFFDTVICLFSFDYLKTTGDIKKYPFAISLLLSFLIPEKPIKTRENYQLYVDLIKQNLQNRAALKEIKVYDPEIALIKTDDPGIAHIEDDKISNRETIKSIWWKTSIEEKKSTAPHALFSGEKGMRKQLFLSREALRPSQMTLPDMLQVITPYIYSENTKESISDDHNENIKILIDISHLKEGEQRYIKDVFLRLINFFYFPPNKPTVDILAGIGKLQITHVSLQEIIDDMTRLSDPAITPATHGCCNTM